MKLILAILIIMASGYSCAAYEKYISTPYIWLIGVLTGLAAFSVIAL